MLFFSCDVSNRKMVFEVVENIKNEIGDISVLVNNAGIMPAHSLLEHTKEEIEAIFGVNVLGHLWVRIL